MPEPMAEALGKAVEIVGGHEINACAAYTTPAPSAGGGHQA
jgi:hypothetical protein